MKKIYVFLLFTLFINPIFSSIGSSLACPKKIDPPQNIKINNSFTINPNLNGFNYSTIKINKRIFTRESQKLAIASYYSDKIYCPSDFVIPTKEFYESLISELGGKAYSILTDENGFNMTENIYYLTSNYTPTTDYTYIYMYIENGRITFGEKDPFTLGSSKINLRCVFKPPITNIIYPNYKQDIEYNAETMLTTDGKYFNGYLWRIDEKIYDSYSPTLQFNKSGAHKVEFWGNLINDDIVYLCEPIYVKKKQISSSQDYDENIIKVIETDFNMVYFRYIHFTPGNCHVAPRIDGGYYITVLDNGNYLHILSYDKNDILLKDFNTTEYAQAFDIVATDYGFVYYAREYYSYYHSYLKLYNKNFELINTIEVMNNNENDNPKNDSNINKQVIRYNNQGTPDGGLRFIYAPEGGKLAYSRGRIFLIFAHYNYFLSEGHTGDSIITFNDLLKDLDFGNTWGSSHSLIQSVTYDEYNFWTAALGDAYPEGISVQITSKRNISYNINDYDLINKKFNKRIYKEIEDLAGYIKGYFNGSSDGRLGGILYFVKLGLYCLIYAKAPNYSKDSYNNKTIIYVTTWKYSFLNNSIYSNQTKEIKIFSKKEEIRVRAGKFGDNKIFIMYTQSADKGLQPKVFIIELPNFKYIQKDVTIKGVLMNTCEDLRTFADGVLIWAASNKDGKLVINKLGTPRLNDSFDDITNILTTKDLNDYENEIAKESNKKKSLSILSKIGIVIGILFGIVLIFLGIFIIWRCIKKRISQNLQVKNLNGPLMSIN